MKKGTKQVGRVIPGTHIGSISLQYSKDKPTKFYQFGIAELDRFTGGLPAGEMTLIAARPGVGKTALVMQFIENIAEKHKKTSGFFSLEMTGRSLVTRMILSRTGLPSIALRKGELTEKERKIRDQALREIADLPIYIDDSSVATLKHIEQTAEKWIDAGIDILALDYMQLIRPSKFRGGSSDTRAMFIGEAARSLKEIAKIHDIPFMVLSQLNRESTKTKTPPTAANLKESGDLEQVADNIIIIHPDKEAGVVDLILDKWRNGPTGTVSCNFDATRTRFDSIKE